MTRLRWGAATDVGVVRSNNEDQLLVAEPLFAVADGMGGHAAGEVASLAAVEALRASFARQPKSVDGLIEAVRDANRAVWERAAEDQSLRGMGTTITAVAIVEDLGEEHVAIANVGDSRAYLLRDGELGMLTEDHSVAEQLVREGRLTPEEAAVHPQRHVLTRVLGLGADTEVDAYAILPYRGDRYLLCSDGLINEVSDSQIASVLRRLADPDEAVKELVAMARANGGHDNITIVLVDVVDDDDRAEVASAALADEPARSTGAGSSETIIRIPEADEVEDPPARAEPLVDEPLVDDDRRRDVQAAAAHSRRVTFRVVLFLVLLVVVLGGAAAAIGFYARGGYYVGLDNSEVAIFKGRPGGLLWFKPTVERRTGLLESNVPPARVDDLQAGKEEPSLAAANRYVANLQEEYDRFVSGFATTTTTVFDSATTTTADPFATTTTTLVP